ncbi:MAG: hypothetical protein IH914_09085 [candidate division Zixibacteria bacterium]|nr:hypothetical protein [candidate division Zixibacteria bacterium]
MRGKPDTLKWAVARSPLFIALTAFLMVMAAESALADRWGHLGHLGSWSRGERIRGSGDVTYYGEPELKKKIRGSGDISQRSARRSAR